MFKDILNLVISIITKCALVIEYQAVVGLGLLGPFNMA